MCIPLASAAIGLQTAGVATSTVGSYFSAKAQKSTLTAQAAISDINARITDLTAQSAIQQGQQQQQASRLQTAKVKSSQRAALAANGIDLGSDTATNILTTTDVMGEIDANTIAANAARTAFGYQTQAMNQRNEAIMSRAASKAINPWMQAGSTLLTGATSIAETAYQYKKVGLLKTGAKE